MKPNALLTFATLLTVAVSAAADQRQDANSDGNLAAIARLVANAGAVHVLNERGNTPLRMAPEAGHAAVIYNDAFSSLRVTSALVRDHIAVIRTFRNVGAHGAIQAPETTGRHRIAKESDNARDANTTIAGQVANKANELVAAVEANVRLLQAAQDGKIVAIESLLANGADPNTKDENGYTPLHWAAERGNVAVIEALVASTSPEEISTHRPTTAS